MHNYIEDPGTSVCANAAQSVRVIEQPIKKIDELYQLSLTASRFLFAFYEKTPASCKLLWFSIASTPIKHLPVPLVAAPPSQPTHIFIAVRLITYIKTTVTMADTIPSDMVAVFDNALKRWWLVFLQCLFFHQKNASAFLSRPAIL